MDVTIPEIAENVDTAEVARILVSEGDEVARDQPLLELEADKASFELPSPTGGRVDGIHVSEGDEVSVGQRAITVDEGTNASGGDARKTDASEDEEVATQEVATQEVARHHEREAESSAKRERGAGEGKDGGRETAKHEGQSAAKREDGAGERSDGGALPPRAAPTTRRLARELGVDLARVPAGSDGRVTKDAVKAFVRERATSSPGGGVERRRLSRLRRTAAERLTEAWRSIPHVTQHEAVDVTELVAARRRYEDGRRDDQPKVTMGALVAFAAVAELADHAAFNAHYDGDESEVSVFSEVHLGVAVDTSRGLVVPVVRNAERARLFDLAASMARAAKSAREGTLDAQDMRGATFTMSNLGGVGGSWFTPIINPPQVAILGVGRARRGAYDADSPRSWQLPLSLSYDHRVIDGAAAVRFLIAIGRRLREPMMLAA
jgi:pyruvate dehydrogenase E2 component (dihydrolipoamide acetyltransferase)